MVSQKPFQIVLARPRGFCAGVDRAITIVEKVLDKYGPPIFVRHEIVHNPHVVERLHRRGAIFVEELENVPRGSSIIFSAHGVSPAVRKQAEKLGLKVVDATCPLVTKVHNEARHYAKNGYTIILIGHPDHVEVKGTVGEAPDRIMVVSSVEDVASVEVENREKISYLTQTTLSINDSTEIIGELRLRFPLIAGPTKNDICYATQNRQNAVKALANEVEMIFVVGAPNSSNTLRLVEVASAAGVVARRIQSAAELHSNWLADIKSLGITAGASAPEDIVQGIVQSLKDMLPGARVRELTLVEENVTFALPSI